MKTINLAILLAVTGIFLFLPSCENTKDELEGKVEFSVSFSDDNLLKSFQADSIGPDGVPIDEYISWHLLVSIVTESGEMVLDNEIIPLFSFGDAFVSERLSLKVGKYALKKFMVIDPYGNVKFASPLIGSDLAYLVNQPLPLRFEILPEEVNHLVPEVLVVMDNNPEDFGYASFGFQVVEPIVAYVMVVDDNPLYMRPSMSIPAVLSLYARDGWHYDYKLTEGVNKILIKSGYEFFKVIVRSSDYHVCEIEKSVSEFMNSSEDNPLVFNIGKTNLLSLVLQPDSEGGKDAMITDLESDKNFGDHPLFEASFITEPVLTVMRTKQSLIQFKLGSLPEGARIESVFLTLTFENIIWDSLWTTGLDDFMIRDQGLVLQQIVEPWEEYEVSWENQPKTIDANQVFIPIWDEFSSNIRTYDVTSLFVPIEEIAAPNYGMMFKHLHDNSFPGGWAFASSDHSVEEMRPKLTVKYGLY